MDPPPPGEQIMSLTFSTILPAFRDIQLQMSENYEKLSVMGMFEGT
jgi:hypothetical protein